MSAERCYCYGLHAVRAMLARSPERIRQLWVLQGRQDKALISLLEEAERLGIRPQSMSRAKLDGLAAGNHQGIVAEVVPPSARDERFLAGLLDRLDAGQEASLLLVLDGVTDPHNLGACLRTADAAGVQAVIAPRDKSAPLSAVAVKVACGAAEAVPYVQVTNLARTLRALQERGFWITGTAGEAEQTLYEARLDGPQVLVMGSEGRGLRRLTRECCDQLVKIPMAGTVSSLNVSVATGVCLFEMVRRRALT